MSNYDSMFAAEIEIFLGTFGRERRIGSRIARCVIDRDLEIQNAGRVSEPFYGLSSNQIRIYARIGDVDTPEVNQTLSVDGTFHRVASVSDEHGMLVITCEENNE